MRFFSVFWLVVVWPFAELQSQEIMSVEEVKTHTRLLVKQPNGAVYIKKLDQFMSLGSAASQPSLQFLSNPRLLEQATLSQSQKSQLDGLKESYQKESRQLVAEFRKAFDKTRDAGERLRLAKEMQEEMNSLQQKVATKIENELIPFQATIIKKFKFKQMSYLGFHKTILRDPFAKDLKLTKEQNREIREISEETDKEIARLIAKAKEKAEAKVRKLLNSDQQAYLRKLTED